MIADAGKVFDSSSAHQNDRVFLKIVPDPRDISRDLYPIRQANASHFSQSRVRFFWRNGIDAGTDTAALRIFLQRRRCGACPLALAAVPYKLLYAWQSYSSFHLEIFMLVFLNFKSGA
jgi:hypothetical protein